MTGEPFGGKLSAPSSAAQASVPLSGNGIIAIDESRKPIFDGEILLCEDSELNQHVIKGHLTRLGFTVSIAFNGKEGVDMALGRMNDEKTPFDLIFMDVHMPVMDGLAAADILSAQGNKAPIVALTANVTDEDKKTYAVHGMPDSLCKPFTTAELWTCLYRYFKPLRYEDVNRSEAMNEEEKRRNKLFTNFVKKNQNTYRDIKQAVIDGDIKLAHRLAHTLRGLAGLMGKSALQEAARVVELSLTGGDAANLEQRDMSVLDAELSAVLDELSPYLDEQKPTAVRILDREKATVLFGKLAALLEDDNASCLELVDELKRVPETDELVAQMEDYEFEVALDILAGLRKSLEVTQV